MCTDTPLHSRERILPSGTVELVVNLCDDEIRIYAPSQADGCARFSGAVISGPYSGFFVIDSSQHALMMGIHFRPGGTLPFLRVPAGELANSHIDLATIWGARAVALRERLCAAATPNQRFSLLEDALVSCFNHETKRHGAVSIAIEQFERTDADVKLHDVARFVGLSQRRFIQVFAAEVGLTPKLYCRIRRFQRARELVRQHTAPNWAATALTCGYFDQSHLIRDFRAFSGLSPVPYINQRSDHVMPNHLPQFE